MSQPNPLLRRFLTKLVVDIPLAAAASAIGGLVLTHYQPGVTVTPPPAAQQSAAASADMVKLVRAEHAVMVDYLNAQLAAEKARLAAEDRAKAGAAAAESIRPAAIGALPHRPVVPAAAARPAMSRAPVALATPVASPVVIAPAQPNDSAEGPRQPETLLAKTKKIKDDVLGATWRVANAIGGIPSWIASVGDRIGAPSTNS